MLVILPFCVAPFAGAWIEIRETFTIKEGYAVAPFAGAWIEIKQTFIIDRNSKVAPFAGAWIEINGDDTSGKT